VKRLLAGIDLGTNTVRILVAEADVATGLVPVWADQVVTRLGEGLAERGRLAPTAAERTLGVIRRYRDRARKLGAAEVLLVATAAVRQAQDGGEFLHQLEAEPGIRPRVVSGEDEARLTLLGALWGLGPVAETFALLDIGGGSTEVLVARGARVLAVVSLALGVVQLAERFFASDPVAAPELLACRTHVDARLRDEAWDRIRPHVPTALVATAGTPTTLAALDLGLLAYDPVRVQGHRLGMLLKQVHHRRAAQTKGARVDRFLQDRHRPVKEDHDIAAAQLVLARHVSNRNGRVIEPYEPEEWACPLVGGVAALTRSGAMSSRASFMCAIRRFQLR
jgi:exopolyphosphatase/guanosine-5'-triphosphate,3'-diphosphate pyrophosphatase